MAAIGSGYDLSCATYGPDGRIFQISYAQKATENNGLGVAIRSDTCITLTLQKYSENALAIDSTPRIFQVDDHILIMVVGMIADGRVLVGKCREVVESYRTNYGRSVPTSVLANMISGFMQLYTHYSEVRPFGCSLIVAGVDDNALSLFHLQPSGDYSNCFATSAGKRMANANVELEKLMGEAPVSEQNQFTHLKKALNNGGKLCDLSENDSVSNAAKVIWACHDEYNDKEFHIEVGVIRADGTCSLYNEEVCSDILAKSKDVSVENSV